MVGHKAVDDGGLALEEYVEDLGALQGGAVIVEDDAGGCFGDADLCTHLRVSVASARWKIEWQDMS